MEPDLQLTSLQHCRAVTAEQTDLPPWDVELAASDGILSAMALPVETPHLAYPFGLSLDGTQAMVNEQDSEAEIMACELLIAHTPIQLREDRADFGWDIPSISQLPINLTELVDAMNRLEPRAVATLQPDGTPLSVLGMGTDNLEIFITISNVDPSGTGLQPQ